MSLEKRAKDYSIEGYKFKEIPEEEIIERAYLIEMDTTLGKTLIFPVFFDGEKLNPYETDIYLEKDKKILEMKSEKEKKEFLGKYQNEIMEETDKYHGN